MVSGLDSKDVSLFEFHVGSRPVEGESCLISCGRASKLIKVVKNLERARKNNIYIYFIYNLFILNIYIYKCKYTYIYLIDTGN